MSSEGPQQRLTLSESDKRNVAEVVPVDENNHPLVKIQCAAAELVPTRQYANVTVGPISVTRWVRDTEDESLLAEVHKVQKICERAVAEERETVHNLIRQSEQGRITE